MSQICRNNSNIRFFSRYNELWRLRKSVCQHKLNPRKLQKFAKRTRFWFEWIYYNYLVLDSSLVTHLCKTNITIYNIRFSVLAVFNYYRVDKRDLDKCQSMFYLQMGEEGKGKEK